ncbi:MAG: type II toxin-antitoxin system VapC family toxin [Gaiellaceae bacterium]
MLYADSSALVRAYFEDEDDHEALRHLLLESGETVVTSELARVELASAVRSASATGRIRDREAFENRIEANYDEGGPLILIELDARSALGTAHRLVRHHRLRTLDAIHLAVALEDAPVFAGSDEVVFVTRDADQAAAARALGLAVR